MTVALRPGVDELPLTAFAVQLHYLLTGTRTPTNLPALH